MIKIIKDKPIKLLKKILNKRKNDIESITHKLPNYKLVQLCSDGSSIHQAEDKEQIIITFTTSLYKEKKSW